MRTMALSTTGRSALQMRDVANCHLVSRSRYSVVRCRAETAVAIPNLKSATQLQGLHDLPKLGKYKAVLLDQFGVLHNGREPYPGTVDGVRQLHEAGIRVLILSNSALRTAATFGKLGKLGFKDEWFEGMVTSGELTYQYLKDRPDAFWKGLGNKVLHITWNTNSVQFDGLGLEYAANPDEADFIIASGCEAISQSADKIQSHSYEELKQVLERAAKRGIPLICANPDLLTVDGAAGLIMMPGTLAEDYKLYGGKVQWMGKPDPVIYQAALKQLGLQASECIGIGDSIIHDIAGANRSGVHSLFISGGIHAEELGLGGKGLETNKTLIEAALIRAMVDKHGPHGPAAPHVTHPAPTYIVPYFQW